MRYYLHSKEPTTLALRNQNAPPPHLHFKAVPYLLHLSSHLVRVQNLQKCFVDIWLALKAVFDLVDIVDGVIELHRLVVLQRRSAGRCAAHRCVRLD